YFSRHANLIKDRRAEFMGVLFTRFGGLNITLHKEMYARIRQEFIDGAFADCGCPAGVDRVLQTVIRERIDVARAANQQMPLILYDRNTDVAVDYLRLSREILEMTGH
ncbi:MAG: ParA family protein, partial [Leptospiraceae bacterium]|nr:ParA family protein [Leptospiraceae bacterium]